MKTYGSKVDAWFVVVVVGVFALSGASVTAAWISGDDEAATGLIILGLTVAFVAWTAFGTKYVLTQKQLLVRAGPFRWRIELRDITAVEPTRASASAPALSCDRLRISYRDKSLMISPKERKRFLRDLETRRERRR